MPWEGTELWKADCDGERILDPVKIAGGETEAVFQPEWLGEDGIAFASDRTGWWNLYAYEAGRARALLVRTAEFGMPRWLFGMKTYVPLSPSLLFACCVADGIWKTGLLSVEDGSWHEFPSEFAEIVALDGGGSVCYLLACEPDGGPTLFSVSVTERKLRKMKGTAKREKRTWPVSKAERIPFESEGRGNHFRLLPSTRPSARRKPRFRSVPLDLQSPRRAHGFDVVRLQFANSILDQQGIRFLGFGLPGKRGNGKAIPPKPRRKVGGGRRRRLRKRRPFRRGAARELLRSRFFIRGSSAGGFTVLRALATCGLFAGGACYYGISDLEELAKQTHKFESGIRQTPVGNRRRGQVEIPCPFPDSSCRQDRLPGHFFSGRGRQNRSSRPNEKNLRSHRGQTRIFGISSLSGRGARFQTGGRTRSAVWKRNWLSIGALFFPGPPQSPTPVC